MILGACDAELSRGLNETRRLSQKCLVHGVSLTSLALSAGCELLSNKHPMLLVLVEAVLELSPGEAVLWLLCRGLFF